MKNAYASCPFGNHTDDIKKVSAVVGEGTRELSGTQRVDATYQDKDGKVSYGTNYVPFSGTQVSVVAQHLSPPPEPTKRSSGCAILFGVLFLLVGVVMLPAGFLMLPMAILSMWGQSDVPIANIILGLVAGGTFFLPFFIIGVAGLVIGILILKSAKNSDKSETERIAREKPLWNEAMLKWNTLYYCSKHDIVFDPNTGKTCAPASTKVFVYQRS